MKRREDFRRPGPAGRSATTRRGLFLMRGQSVMETSILFMVIFFAFLAMITYIKRAVQGRLRTDADSLGQQYDYERTVGQMATRHDTHTTTQTATTEQSVTDPWTHMAQNRMVTTSVTEIHYDNSSTTGNEVVGPP